MLDFIKRDWLLLLILAGAAGYLFYLHETRPIPCVTPIEYSVMSFNERFPISKAQLLETLDDAAKVWNEAIGKEVFVEAEHTPDLPIYMVYDERQAIENVIAELDAEIEAKQVKLEELREIYLAKKEAFDEGVRAGRATQRMVREVNEVVAQYEALRLDINADVAAYNRTIPQDEFTEARYLSDKSGQRIEVYSFEDRVLLQRVFEHELGHALGLEHVVGEESIMYRVNKRRNLELSAADIAELERVCSAPQPFFPSL